MDPYFIIVMYCIVNVQGKKLCMNDCCHTIMYVPSSTFHMQIDYPKDSDMMEVFECQKTLTNK